MFFHEQKEARRKAVFFFLVCKNNGIRGRLCSRLTTVRLISSVLTVILLITGPAHRNAATAGASKEVHWTFKLSLICETKEKKKIIMGESLTISENPKALWNENTAPNLGSFSHQKSLHSRCCRHTPMKADNTE